MKSIPKCKVGILKAKEVELESRGRRTLIKRVPIGIGFHWQREMDFLVEGDVSVIESSDGMKQVVVEMDVESYLEGVISSEMNPEAPFEFLKAHAIISRSWLMRKILRLGNQESESIGSPSGYLGWEESGSHKYFDVCCDDHCQRYQGIECVNENAKAAVSATKGMVLYAREEGEIADARFSKCCGGITETFSTAWADEDKSYLQPIADPYCNPGYLDPETREKMLSTVLKDYDRETTASDYYLWHKFIDLRELSARIRELHGVDIGEIYNVTAAQASKSGRIKHLSIEGKKGDFIIGKELAIRRLMAKECLRSSLFLPVFVYGDYLRLIGRGWGHGVGLCQIGAATMAYAGKSCEEILAFYYPKTVILKDYAK